VTSGILAALQAVLSAAPQVDAADVRAVMIGTTHFTNAVIQRQGLARTAVLRLCLPAGQMIPPLYDWPADLREAAGAATYMLPGGYEYDGRPISALDNEALARAIDDIAARGIESVAVVGIFSPVSADQEREVAAIVGTRLPGVAVSTSYEIGRIGLLQRENATALNACLAGLAQRTLAAFRAALRQSGLSAQLYLSQNDGTLMTADYVERYPVLTFASGPTNSMRGAAFLSGASDAIVLDVGGTSTDAGALVHGFPREASFEVEVGGVRTNFRMPDVVSIGIGGGSLVAADGSSVGPRSVGYRLPQEALIFGGDTLTLTDVAVHLGRAEIGEPGRVERLDRALAEQAMAYATARLEELVDALKTSPEPVPVIMVGGGALLFENQLAGASQVIRPEHAGVANALGAAISQVSGELDRVFPMDARTRLDVLDEAKAEASRLATAAGADPATIEIVEIDEIPLAYLPSSALRLRVKAVGDLRKS
jgi:N-methylhydantoinase A/oxoprolinase/acetone carboxylase beta subunit